MFFIWAIWYRLSTKKLLKDYYNSKAYGKEKNKRALIAGREGSIGKTSDDSPGLPKPSERELLETTTPNSVRKNSKSIRGFFKTYRNRRRK